MACLSQSYSIQLALIHLVNLQSALSICVDTHRYKSTARWNPLCIIGRKVDAFVDVLDDLWSVSRVHPSVQSSLLLRVESRLILMELRQKYSVDLFNKEMLL